LLQETLLAFRRSPKPVVVAVHSRALGGGAEVVLGSSRVVAHAESYIGLVETGVGLIPAAGGVTEFVRRQLSPAMRVNHTDPLPLAQQILQTIGFAKVGASAAESRVLGFLTGQDRVVMNRDQLLYEGKQEVLAMAAQGYTPPPATDLFAGGRDLLAALKAGLWQLRQAGQISGHDALVGGKLAWIIAGGDLSAPQWLPEEHFLALELEAFIELATTEKTQARIRHMLDTGKPLRN
jgi:3-hydroxyacyl-CoA dehydrogenase